jgi:hypothetical protein
MNSSSKAYWFGLAEKTIHGQSLGIQLSAEQFLIAAMARIL